MGAEHGEILSIMKPDGSASFANQPARHSYDKATRSPFYREVDRRTILMAPVSSRVVDVATGTGEIISHLLAEGKLRPDANVLGVDVDRSALIFARQKFAGHTGIDFHESSAEQLPLRTGSCDLVTFCNAIHLTDVPRSLQEVARVLETGGVLVGNSAYVKGIAYLEDVGLEQKSFAPSGIIRPDGTFIPDGPGPTSNKQTVSNGGPTWSPMDAALTNGTHVESNYFTMVDYLEDGGKRWGQLGRGAIRRSMRKGAKLTEKPTQLDTITPQGYIEHMHNAGLTQVQTAILIAEMDYEAVKAMIDYDEFRKGALPGVDDQTAHNALLESLDEIFTDLRTQGKQEVFPRGWMLFYAQKQ